MEKQFQKIKEIVEAEFSCSAHKMDHVARVYDLCLYLAQGAKVDLDVIRAAALLHDIGRTKEDSDKSGKTDHALIGAQIAEQILKKLKFFPKKIKEIKHCILSHRYRAAEKPKTREAQILFDADKLDSLGAIGVGRAFAWAGRHRAHLYKVEDDIEDYIKKNLGGKINGRIKDKTKHSPQIEFATKLKFLVNRLFTKKAKKIGRARIKYFQDFLKRLEKEMKGEL